MPHLGERRTRTEEARKSKDDGYHPEIERRMLSVLDDVRGMHAEEEQEKVRLLLAEGHYASALRCLRHYLSPHLHREEYDGIRLSLEGRLRDIDTMLRDYGDALLARYTTNPQSKVDDRLARIEGAMNETKVALTGIARRSTFQHWVLVLMAGAIGAMAGVLLLR